MKDQKSLSSGDLDRRQFLRRLAGTTAVAGVAAAAGCTTATVGTPDRPVVVKRRRGGNLKVGLTGGSGTDTVDPHRGLTYLDSARLQSLYNSLVQLNAQAEIEYVLAESITPRHGSPSEWVIRLRP